jgi:uncharacterized protein
MNLVYRNDDVLGRMQNAITITTNDTKSHEGLSKLIFLRVPSCTFVPFVVIALHLASIIPTMTLSEQIQKDITTAMKARDEQRLSCLRMVKTALKNREIEKMAPLDDKEAQQVLSTLIKQRKDSVEQFTKGGRQEMADKEAAEIKLIETYLPKAAGEEDIVAGVKAVIAEMGTPTMKDMGTVMKNVMARLAGGGMRVDGKQVSEVVKRELTPK